MNLKEGEDVPEPRMCLFSIKRGGISKFYDELYRSNSEANCLGDRFQ